MECYRLRISSCSLAPAWLEVGRGHAEFHLPNKDRACLFGLWSSSGYLVDKEEQVEHPLGILGDLCWKEGTCLVTNWILEVFGETVVLRSRCCRVRTVHKQQSAPERKA